jgi:integrative and conjugative element protein (TIGR02256 family)
MMDELRFQSADGHFGLHLSANMVEALLHHCGEIRGRETGGILVGSYNPTHDCAIVSGVTPAPNDSTSGTTWFHRGISGLQQLLNRLWRRREYYLGEWHFHPAATPTPSGVDWQQMRDIAASGSYRCPEPILLIVGGDPVGAWQVRVFVSPVNRQPVELLQSATVGYQ